MVRKSVEEIKLELIRRIERSFGDRVTEITICELVDVPNHYILRLIFRAYDYYWVQFNYDNDLCGFSSDWDSYLKEIMAEIELRIPDEFLKAKGWL